MDDESFFLKHQGKFDRPYGAYRYNRYVNGKVVVLGKKYDKPDNGGNPHEKNKQPLNKLYHVIPPNLR
jgi:hypothetical protein